MAEQTPFRDRLWTMFHDEESAPYRRVMTFISVLILFSLVLLVLELELIVSLDPKTLDAIKLVDNVILSVWLVEFMLRLGSYRPAIPRTVDLNVLNLAKYHVLARIRFCFRPMILIDIVALLPLLPGGFRALRLLRILRLLRAYQFFRYYNPFETLASAIAANSLLFGFTVGFLLISILLGGTIFYFAEVTTNPEIHDPFDALYWAVVTLTTVGYGDITPSTSEGAVIAVALMFSGMTTIALFAGVISQTLVGHLLQLRQEQVRMSTISNHIVICGWNPNVPLLLEELQAEYRHVLPEIIVFANREQSPQELDPTFRFVPGDATKENELDKVRMSMAQSVIIVAADGAQGPADANTILTLFTIRSYESKLDERGINRNRPLHLCCEVHDPENISHARTAGADDIVLTARLSSDLLAHASAYPGMSGIFSTLLSPTDQNIYIESIPVEIHGGEEALSFQEIFDKGRAIYEALVIGYELYDGDREIVNINPKPHERVPTTARMIYLAPAPISGINGSKVL